jgi:hypothetical protein
MGYTVVARLMGLRHHKQVFITHVFAHRLTSASGHVETDTLSKIKTEKVHPFGVFWLHKTLNHVGA